MIIFLGFFLSDKPTCLVEYGEKTSLIYSRYFWYIYICAYRHKIKSLNH